MSFSFKDVVELRDGTLVSFLRVGRVFLSMCVFKIQDSSGQGFSFVLFEKEGIGMVKSEKELKEKIFYFIERIEKKTGYHIEKIILSMDEKYVNSAICEISKNFDLERCIKKFHIKELIANAVHNYLAKYDNDIVLDVINGPYTLDNCVVLEHPLNFNAKRLSFFINIIASSSVAIESVVKSFSEYNFRIVDIIPISLCSAAACTFQDQHVLHIHMGSKNTSFVVKKDGYFACLDLISFGGDEITKEICKKLEISLVEAEKMKILLGDLTEEGARYDNNDVGFVLDPEGRGGSILRKKDLEVLQRIIKTSVEKVFSMIKSSLITKDLVNFEDITLLVLTGGVANTRGIDLLAKKSFGICCKIGTDHLEEVEMLEFEDRAILLPAIGAIRYFLQKRARLKIWFDGRFGLLDLIFFKLSCFFDRWL